MRAHFLSSLPLENHWQLMKEEEPLPLKGAVEKSRFRDSKHEADQGGMKLYSFLAERQPTTPPLRGSRRGRAFFAKADSVGGKMRFIAIPNHTPHQFTFGLTPSVHCRSSRGGKTDPQGGSELQRRSRNPNSLAGTFSTTASSRALFSHVVEQDGEDDDRPHGQELPVGGYP